ncbi:MAG: metalloregulator ArsR/SmtB family transcription factor [Actinomycetota bacterium]|nr:metalloregulator ArsR/SmtB family transcription factor [Actinomycetota bacterium]
MVNYSARSLDATFRALADPTRRAMLSRLTEGEFTVTELADPFPVTLPAITKHLGVLKDAGLVTQTREGRIRRCRLEPEPLQEAGAWIAATRRFWNERLDALAAYLEGTEK